MKKILIVLVLGNLMFSCAKEESAIPKSEEKRENAIVDPGDPDMNRIVNGQLVGGVYANAVYPFGKGYLMINETKHTIRMNMYALPKFTFTANRLDTRMETRDKFFVLDFLITPNQEHHGQVGGVYGQSTASPSIKGPIELWDHMYRSQWDVNTNLIGVLPSIPNFYFWNKYPIFSNPYAAGSEFKVAFIEFWVIKDNEEGEHHWLALETPNSFNQILSNNPYPKFTSVSLPFSFPVNDIEFFGIRNELPSSPQPQWVVYYLQNNGNPISNTAYDPNYHVNGTFRYMPYVTSPGFPAENPDNTPGYIIKFENM